MTSGLRQIALCMVLSARFGSACAAVMPDDAQLEYQNVPRMRSGEEDLGAMQNRIIAKLRAKKDQKGLDNFNSNMPPPAGRRAYFRKIMSDLEIE